MIPDVLAARYASAELVALWSPEEKVRAERRLWLVVLPAPGASSHLVAGSGRVFHHGGAGGEGTGGAAALARRPPRPGRFLRRRGGLRASYRPGRPGEHRGARTGD